MTISQERAMEVLRGKLEGILKGFKYGSYSDIVARSQADGAISMCRDLGLINFQTGKMMYNLFCESTETIKGGSSE